MTDAPAAEPVTREPTVPLDARARLVHISEERFRSVCTRMADHDFSGKWQEAACFHELATLENDTLRKLRLFMRAQLAYEELAAEMEAMAKALKAVSESLAARTIPDLMENNEMEYFGLTGGVQVVLEEKIRSALPAEKQEAGCAVIEALGYGTLVKRTITVPLDTKQAKLADKILKAIRRTLENVPGVEVSDTRNIHHSTLGKWVRDRLASGEEFSTEHMKLFGVFRQKRAVIKEKRSKD